jgi:hypothetical protein
MAADLRPAVAGPCPTIGRIEQCVTPHPDDQKDESCPVGLRSFRRAEGTSTDVE